MSVSHKTARADAFMRGFANSPWTRYPKASATSLPHDCSGSFRLERLPGGTCTHWKAPPSQGARHVRTFEKATVELSSFLIRRHSRYLKVSLIQLPPMLNRLEPGRPQCIGSVGGPTAVREFAGKYRCRVLCFRSNAKLQVYVGEARQGFIDMS